MSFNMSSLWGVLTILGPVALVIAIVWAMRHNRGTPEQVQATEDATRRMYDEQSRLDDAADRDDQR